MSKSSYSFVGWGLPKFSFLFDLPLTSSPLAGGGLSNMYLCFLVCRVLCVLMCWEPRVLALCVLWSPLCWFLCVLVFCVFRSLLCWFFCVLAFWSFLCWFFCVLVFWSLLCWLFCVLVPRVLWSLVLSCLALFASLVVTGEGCAL